MTWVLYVLQDKSRRGLPIPKGSSDNSVSQSRRNGTVQYGPQYDHQDGAPQGSVLSRDLPGLVFMAQGCDNFKIDVSLAKLPHGLHLRASIFVLHS